MFDLAFLTLDVAIYIIIKRVFLSNKTSSNEKIEKILPTKTKYFSSADFSIMIPDFNSSQKDLI
ncbi:hypothetical protein BpHYR1_005951 [Brachionus plicatilis]|uniref:Uncharacterized protein n=1 Tax=Brachionus plicatilis TaxID=10195 RepID=A0A3M7PGR9_BRAPC|nr:hypothetical protein BpHYR1_005951 [Brachionus plicatilis]